MFTLFLAAFFFFALHAGIAGTSARGRLIARLGENAYRGLFSLLSLLGLIWLAHAYRETGHFELWGQLAWFKPVAAGLMLVAIFLAVHGMATPNPMAVGGESLLDRDTPALGIQRITRHPFLCGVALWALTHLIVNGDLASLILFGTLLALVLVGMRSIDARRRAACGDHWTRYAAVTSVAPFLAIREGRNRLVLAEFKPWPSVVAVALYLALLHFHKSWFGVSPLF